MSSEYTAQDFARASFARKGPDLAMRYAPKHTFPWRKPIGWNTDADMAEDGWTPVVEAGSEPMSLLDFLQRLWDRAEVADRAEKGDEVIAMMHKNAWEYSDIYQVTKVGAAYEVPAMEDRLHCEIRILRRAPKPKTVEERLAELIGGYTGAYVRPHGGTVKSLMHHFNITPKEDEK